MKSVLLALNGKDGDSVEWFYNPQKRVLFIRLNLQRKVNVTPCYPIMKLIIIWLWFPFACGREQVNHFACGHKVSFTICANHNLSYYVLRTPFHSFYRNLLNIMGNGRGMKRITRDSRRYINQKERTHRNIYIISAIFLRHSPRLSLKVGGGLLDLIRRRLSRHPFFLVAYLRWVDEGWVVDCGRDVWITCKGEEAPQSFNVRRWRGRRRRHRRRVNHPILPLWDPLKCFFASALLKWKFPISLPPSIRLTSFAALSLPFLSSLQPRIHPPAAPPPRYRRHHHHHRPASVSRLSFCCAAAAAAYFYPAMNWGEVPPARSERGWRGGEEEAKPLERRAAS